jgi:membrane-associated phospholipid phosphatase
MFQSEANLLLQSLGSPALDRLMTAVTWLGYLPVYVVLTLVLAFGVRLRPALAVMAAVLLAGLATDAAKNAVAFPRPDEVDPRVVRTAAARPLPGVDRGGARSFWSLPDAAAIAAARARGSGNYGFPSGHVSVAAAFLLSVAFYYRARPVALFALLWTPLMAFSRMYLGRHFLADVLGGAVLAVLAVAASVLLFRRLDRDAGWRDRGAMRPLHVLVLLLVALATVSALVPARYAGALLGLALAHGVIAAGGAPPEGGAPGRRLARVLLAGVLFGLAFAVTEAVRERVGVGSAADRPAALVASALVVLAGLGGTVAVTRRLEPPPAPP